eukprot:414317-Rhodomonas_salina.2
MAWICPTKPVFYYFSTSIRRRRPTNVLYTTPVHRNPRWASKLQLVNLRRFSSTCTLACTLPYCLTLRLPSREFQDVRLSVRPPPQNEAVTAVAVVTLTLRTRGCTLPPSLQLAAIESLASSGFIDVSLPTGAGAGGSLRAMSTLQDFKSTRRLQPLCARTSNRHGGSSLCVRCLARTL